MSSLTSPQAGAHLPRTKRRPARNQKQAIFLVSVPGDFRPQRPWDWPSGIGGAIFARNLSTHDAAIFARVHNEAQIRRHQETGEPIGLWAICAHCLNPYRRTTLGPVYPSVRLFDVFGKAAGRVVVAVRGPGTPDVLRSALVEAIATLDAQAANGADGAEVRQ